MILFVLHGSDCQSCVDYLEDLALQSSEFRWWGGHLVAVVPEIDPGARALATRIQLPVVVDPEGSARKWWRIGTGDAALIVADRWGQVYLSADARGGHDLPDPAGEVMSVVTRIGIQCPECGVPDVP